MRWPTRFLIFMAVLVASCTPVDNATYDWCYQYDFTSDSYGFAIAAGTWTPTEQGFMPDASGLLQISHTHDQIVAPSVVNVWIVRPPEVTGDINILAAGQIYGIDAGMQEVMPGALDVAIVPLRPASLGDGSASINVAIESSQPIQIIRLEVSGMGVSPFSTNPCDPELTQEPTVISPSGTPGTMTPSTTTPAPATITGTPSLTPTAVATGTVPPCVPAYEFVIKFGSAAAGYLAINGTPYPVASSEQVVDLLPGDTITIGQSWVNFFLTNPRVYPTLGLYTVSGASFVVTPSDLVNVWYLIADVGSTESYQAWASATEYNWLAVPWNTQAYTSATLTLVSVDGPTTACPTSTPPPASSTPTLTPTSLGGTPTPNGSGTPIPGTFLPGTGTPSRTPPATSTPPTLTRTPLPSSTPRPPTRTPIPLVTTTPIIIPTLDATPIFGTGTPNATPSPIGTVGGTGVPSPVGTPYDIPYPPGYGTGDGDGGAGVGLGNLSSIIQGLGDTINGWWGATVGRLNGFVSAFWDAPPVPIPGLPQCMSAPMLHDICAIYYIMKWTFFAANTPGALILPLGQIVFGLVLLVLSSRYIMFLIRSAMQAIQGGG